VTALRSFIEDRGSDFSANVSGKLKMVFQCVAAVACLLYLSYLTGEDKRAPTWCWALMVGSVWSTVLLTVYSGIVYVRVAIGLLRGEG
jgi:CDP-diacylglycerol---glycerol-3-phosphate 3-phosphatidyltransferase